MTLVELAKSRLHDITDQDMIIGVGMLMDKLALKTQVSWTYLLKKWSVKYGICFFFFANTALFPLGFSLGCTTGHLSVLPVGYAFYPHQI